ncbi:iron complex outermembrane receptor protein [Pelomonas saccharophila]|uniref:Iron complex outermembrane receptor protein n=1 Tax=Roseateles saccharophilus TaxID=304 RepID=A0ABU1YKA4_ROSSA|nr:TonB-dependent receptor [Roseateles saccharophilus]MDR7269296.1 iron complex outermembrane receptor protein [Roseateles saccharophilus]
MTRSFTRHPLAHAALLCAVALHAQAQQQEQKLERVEITGSSIKRIDGEAVLPVDIIKRGDIDKAGVTTAAELLQKITSNVGGLTDGASISDQSGAQRGFNGANLRGLGVSSTLVLLNGRRLANFASPGDNAGVDLNNIPAGAIQRVEVLKDGASAIYGTDAMGGVINFITRKDYVGADVTAYALRTQEGGAGKTSFSASGGFGDLSKDRFNVFAALDVQKLDALDASQRGFIQEYSLPTRLPPQTSSNSFPANVDLSSAQLAALNAFVLANPNTALKGSNANGTWNPGGVNSGSRRVNFGKSSCTGGINPNSVQPLGLGGREGCSYDYVAGSEIYPKSDKASVIGRATFQVAEDHQLFIEALFAKTDTDYAASPATARFRTASGITLPASLQAVTGVAGPVDFRFRLEDAGKRVSRVESQATRVVAGAVGRFGEWDYDTALNYSVNKATDTDLDGWVSLSKLEAGLKAGQYNPFVRAADPSAGRAFMNSIRIDGAARIAEGSSTSLDGKLTRALAALGGGDLMLALGAELRREKLQFRATDALKSNDVNNDRSSSGPLLADTDHHRDVMGAFAELSAPFTKQWEGQFAIRHDRYDGIYDAATSTTSPKLNTTNPKVGISFRPDRALLARASYGTGFRAPTVSELFRPLRSGITASFVRDPISGEVAQMAVDRYSNPALQPEKSKQYNLGIVFEPSRSWNGSVDYWAIRKTDIISEIGEETIFTNPVYYNDPTIVRRFSDGFVDTVTVKKENRGKLSTSGLDVSLAWRGENSAYGRFGASLAGTLITEYKFNTDPRSPMVSGLARFRDDKAVQRWRHKLNVDWDMGPFGLTVANNYLSGYRDQNTPGLAAPEWNDRDVKAYSLWDLTASYRITPELRLRGGVLNVADTAPPFTNQSRYFQVTWDPTYGDPRGRSYFVSLSYQLR